MDMSCRVAMDSLPLRSPGDARLLRMKLSNHGRLEFGSLLDSKLLDGGEVPGRYFYSSNFSDSRLLRFAGVTSTDEFSGSHAERHLYSFVARHGQTRQNQSRKGISRCC
jgi:hypothetical protein